MQSNSKNFFLGAVIAILLITTVVFGVLWVRTRNELRVTNPASTEVTAGKQEVSEKTAVEGIRPEQFGPELTAEGLVEGWKTYRNEKYKYELKYPPDFVVYSDFKNEKPVLKNEDNILIGENSFVAFMHPSGVSIRIIKENIMDISDFGEWFWKNLIEIYLVTDVEPYRSEDLELIRKSLRYASFRNMPAIEIELPEQKIGLGWPFKILLLENNDIGFIIKLIGHSRVNMTILSTFKFIE